MCVIVAAARPFGRPRPLALPLAVGAAVNRAAAPFKRLVDLPLPEITQSGVKVSNSLVEDSDSGRLRSFMQLD